MPQMRMNSLKSLAMNCGPLSEMIRGVTPGNFSRARCTMISTSASVIDSLISQCTTYPLQARAPGEPGVGLVDLTVPPLPVVVLAGRDADPGHHARAANLGPLRPVTHKVHDRVPRVVGNPTAPP